MLPEWYFCCCINATPEATNAFLCLLETLDNPESDDRLLYLALEELQLMDVWMRAYAILRILEWRHQKERSPSLQKQVRAYLEGLRDNLPVEMDEAFTALINSLLSRVASQREVFRALEKCAEGFDKSSQREASPTPYMDLREFLPETFLLSVVASESKHSESFAAELSRMLVANTSVAATLQSALDNEFGRLALRLAVRVAILNRAGQSQANLLAAIWRSRPSTPSVEPDLLHATAEITFSHHASKLASDESAVDQIHLEMQRLSALRKLISGRRTLEPYRIGRRIGFPIKDDRELSMPVVFWQSILWELSASIDPVDTARRIANAWRPISREHPELINPKSGHESPGTWKRYLEVVLRLNLTGRVEVETSREPGRPFDESWEWMLLSPWVRRDPSNKWVRYPDTTRNPEIIIRLVAAIAVASGLLLKLPEDNEHRRELGAFIAHSHDVLDVFRSWLRTFNQPKAGPTQQGNRKQPPRLPMPVTGLALFGRRQARLIGTGNLERVTPELFVEMLRSASELDHASARSSEELEFYQSVLPEVMMSWIADAYTSSTDTARSGRWLRHGLIQELYSHFTPAHEEAEHAKLDRIEAALVTRFLSPDTDLNLPFDWQTEALKLDREKKPWHWRVSPRMLLLTQQGLPAREWLKDWEEANSADRAEIAKERATRIVRSLERLASLKKPEGITPEIAEAWRRDWMERLNGVGQLKELDRNIRLRLLEIITDPVLKDSLDGQELIAFVLLEYASAYEIVKLFEYVFSPLDGEASDASSTRSQLKRSVLTAMWRELQRQNKAKLKRQRVPRNPRETLIDYQKAILIRDWIVRLAYSIVSAQGDQELAALGRLLVDLTRESRSGAGTSGNQSIRTEVELTGDNKELVLRGLDTTIYDWSVKAATYDPNQLAMSFLYENFDLKGLDNLFQEPRIADSYVENEIHEVIAVVLAAEPAAGGTTFTFSWGLPIVTTKTLDNAPAFESGQYVVLPLQKKLENNRIVWRVAEDRPISQLPTKSAAGEIRELIVKEYSVARKPTRFLAVMLEDSKLDKEIDLKSWDADVSRCFQTFDPTYEAGVYARHYADGNWRPIDLSLIDLLLHCFTKSQQFAVLTFIEDAEGPFGQAAWRFSTEPGVNYVILQNEFEPDAMVALQRKIGALGKKSGAFGLIITVRPTMVEGKVRIGLVLELPESFAEPLLPQLKAPFDGRNIEWRQLFDSTENPVAVRDSVGTPWHYKLAPDVAAGYPREIQVEMRHAPPTDLTAEFTAEDWKRSARTGIVNGEHPRQQEINLRNKSLSEFIAWWENLRAGQRLMLASPHGRVRTGGQGFVECLTDNHLIVNVEVESLTMRPLELEEKPRIRRLREAEVIYRGHDREVPLVIDFRQIPEEAIIDNRCEGILFRMPLRRGKVCKVFWQTRGEFIPQEDLKLENLDKVYISQGCRIEGTLLRNGQWEFVGLQPYIQVRALWSLDDWQPGQQPLSYLGPVFQESTRARIPLAELEPGKLVRLNRQPAAHHLAVGDGVVFSGGVSSDLGLRNVARESTDRRARSRRVMLNWANLALPGNCVTKPAATELSLTNVSLALREKGHGLVELRRDFEVERSRRQRHQTEGDTLTQTAAIWRSRLDEYFEREYDLPVTFERKGKEAGVRLPDNDPRKALRVPPPAGEKDWSPWVPLYEKGGPYIVGNLYPPEEATARLFESSDGGVLASFRLVPPLSAEDYQEELQADFNERWRLKERLYYADREEFDEDGNRYPERHHRFELGYGKTLLVPESKLLFRGGEFKKKRFTFFRGDFVTRLQFLPDIEPHGRAGQLEGDLAGCIINILDYEISLAHSLYRQRADHGVVHLLDVTAHNGKLKINSVEGIDENHLGDKLRAFDSVDARLSDASEERLLRRLQERDDPEHFDFLILGRLNEELCFSSLGREIVFEHVRLSFVDSPLGPPLKSDERVFLQAGLIIKHTNSIGVLLNPPRYENPPKQLPRNDIGNDVFSEKTGSKIWLERRSFSGREDLLRRVLKQYRWKALEGTFLLTRLNQSEDRRSIHADLINGGPSRKDTALAGKITRETTLFATVITADDNKIKLELDPGIFVRIQSQQIVEKPGKLERGAVVRIQNAPATPGFKCRFKISDAAFADSRYVTGQPRAAVVLPKNNMLSRKIWEEGDISKVAFWVGRNVRRGFTIGGLPNIAVSPGFFDPETANWEEPRPEDLTRLMQTRHPKLGLVGHDRPTMQFRFSPLPQNSRVGSLEMENGGLEVHFKKAAGETLDSMDKVSLSWSQLSFRDESAQEIGRRASQEFWEYHDTDTGTWTTDGRIVPSDTGKHDIWRGPLFFENDGEQLKLRYSKANFTRFGFPAEELIFSLTTNHTGRWRYPVAGVSDSGTRSLWIEIAPGRIAELPANRIILRLTEGIEKSLSQMNWSHFSPGDQITFESDSQNPFRVDRVVLAAWIPGPRQVFGPQRACLPVDGLDTTNGALFLGQGQFRLTYPDSSPSELSRVVVLYPNNELEDITGSDDWWPQRGDVVMIGFDDDGAASVLGLEHINPIPMQSGSGTDRRSLLSKSSARDLCVCLGGALPVTVEEVDKQNGTLSFSWRHQRFVEDVPAGSITVGYLVGLLPGGKALLRCAGGFRFAEIDQIVSGLPQIMFEVGAEYLKQARVPIWMHADSSNKLTMGLDPELFQEAQFKGVRVLNRDDIVDSEGLICRSVDSMKLYWLPKKKASWASLTTEQFGQVFAGKRLFRARILQSRPKTPTVSVIDVREIEREFSELTIGKELAVTILAQVDPGEGRVLRYIAESSATKVILNCETYDDPLAVKQSERVEVLRRRSREPLEITTIPLRKKTQKLDIPDWMSEDLPKPGEYAGAITKYLDWRSQPQSLGDFLDIDIAAADDETIQRILCYAYNNNHEVSPENLKLTFEASDEWVKRSLEQPEINLTYALMAVLLLDKCGRLPAAELLKQLNFTDEGIAARLSSSWRNKALLLTQDLGRRALRSAHLEVLSRYWLLDHTNRNRDDGLWQRLQQMLNHLPKPTIEGINTIREFCYAVELRNREDLRPIADGLLAILGELPKSQNPFDRAEVSQKLIQICRTLPRAKKRLWLQDSHIKDLSGLLQSIDVNGWYITLLDPIPQFELKSGPAS